MLIAQIVKVLILMTLLHCYNLYLERPRQYRNFNKKEITVQLDSALTRLVNEQKL